MPLRDERRGRRATIGSGTTPLRAAFVTMDPTTAITPAETPIGVGAENVRPESELDPSFDAAAAPANAARDGGGSTVEVTSNAPSHANASSGANQRRSLLEPYAALMALARPLFALWTACMRLMQVPLAPNDVEGSAYTAPTLDSTPSILSERSFASEVASLLQLPVEPETHDVQPVPIAAALTERSADAVPLDERSANAESLDDRSPNAIPLEAIPAVEATLDANAHEREPEDSFKAYAPDGVSLNSGASATESRTRQNLVVVRVPARPERVVPITRLPLRPQGLAITWTADVPEFAQSDTHSRAERHALLERLIRDTASIPSEVIARAYREEDGEGRTLALRVLLRNDPEAGRSAFIEALRVGSDDERALAVDGLGAIGARDALTPAFADRVDAIAAKAALSYVGTLARADYRVRLAPFIDEKQIDTILTLLAGIVE